MRDSRVDFFWSRPLLDWMKASVKRNARVLDFGCGHFGVGAELLKDGIPCDGYDPDVDLIAQVKKKYPDARLTSDPNQLERCYDWVIVNSVSQYLGSEKNLHELFLQIEKVTNPGAKVLVVDVIHTKHSMIAEMLGSVLPAAKEKVLLALLKSWYSASSSWNSGEILKVNDSFFESLPHFKSKRLGKNLSVSRQRRSYLLERVDGRDSA